MVDSGHMELTSFILDAVIRQSGTGNADIRCFFDLVKLINKGNHSSGFERYTAEAKAPHIIGLQLHHMTRSQLIAGHPLPVDQALKEKAHKMKASIQQLLRGITLASLTKSPNEVPLCHCLACRATSGVLCTSYYSLLTPEPTLPPHSKLHYSNELLFSNPYLREYVQSTRLSRWFCGICGGHVLAQLKPENRYLIAAGLVVPAALPVVSDAGCVAVHWGVEGTRDGGLSVFMPGSVNDKGTGCLVESVSTASTSIPPSTLRDHNVGSQGKGNAGKDHLKAECHCGGISFTVTRPNDQSKEPWSPWPDMIVPYHSGSPKNTEDVKWWLRANETKYFAGTCACNSCRLTSGFPIQVWAFIPKANLFINQVDTFTYETGTMKRFESSPGVYREFCSTCGATAFWHCDERPGVVDVSVGLLRSIAGARAGDWLEWATGRVSFAEDAQVKDKGLIELLERGLKSFTDAQNE
ncbi:DUF636 domain protein [Talaromyces stipitatus ATCC 10500]|uniref:DUF636 domain protein n=1 Tax=Talaromyces stipitatus (strain ATCC 10500 / CBS 375.48 / QM 6759 / NRRL 1006) TaxID=441959 RepID=B8LZB3_TALSN|nr:DUF636 domain protein [Talaromyces stipitatus ATCC 10500]EED21666.1 DUF636 domain protein [Talaromyces stipitatus ATCC 10500]